MKPKCSLALVACGVHWAKVPNLPGVYTQAETLEELEANLREAIELYLSDDSAVDAAVATENGRVLEIAV
jgi:predicted RNase H-like HicB family nuclease